MVEWDRKSYSGPAEIASFSRHDFIRSNKHGTFWRILLTGYFYILFVRATAVSDFHPLGIYKNPGPPLPTITFTVNSHTDNHFHRYIYLFQYYTVWNQFFIKIHIKVFIFKFDLNFLNSFFFLVQIKTIIYRKKHFIAKNMKKYWITCCTHMMSHAIWVDEKTGVMVPLKKYQQKLKHFEKKFF